MNNDINSMLPPEVAKKFKLKEDIPGPAFILRGKGITKFEFDVRTLTVEKCEDLMKAKFPWIEKVQAPKKEAKADKEN